MSAVVGATVQRDGWSEIAQSTTMKKLKTNVAEVNIQWYHTDS